MGKAEAIQELTVMVRYAAQDATKAAIEAIRDGSPDAIAAAKVLVVAAERPARSLRARPQDHQRALGGADAVIRPGVVIERAGPIPAILPCRWWGWLVRERRQWNRWVMDRHARHDRSMSAGLSGALREGPTFGPTAAPWEE